MRNRPTFSGFPSDIRPAADYYAVKITIAESEQYAIHEEELRARPGDFGADFLGRALPAVLYSGTDYVQAQRERRLMLAEMAPIYEKFDVLVTPAAPGPAPRLGTWRTISFWQNSSLTTPFNVTGGPALAQCMGFTSAGLPLSLQLVGCPFDEATVLRAAHAYETATNWRGRRPHLDPAATFSSEPPAAIRPEPTDEGEQPLQNRRRGAADALPSYRDRASRLPDARHGRTGRAHVDPKPAGGRLCHSSVHVARRRLVAAVSGAAALGLDRQPRRCGGCDRLRRF